MKKWCNKCERLLDTKLFNKSSERKDGLQSNCRECKRSFIRDYDRRNAKKRNAAQKIRRHLHPEKLKAYNAVQKALKVGTITKSPCEICEEPKAHAHHEDYSKPLDVMWLCPLHHNERHKIIDGAEKNDTN